MADKNTTSTPETENANDIHVTLNLEDGDKECRILTIFEVNSRDYIALIPLDEMGNDNPNGDVYIYGYGEDDEGLPSISYIADEEEYEAAAERFDELQDEELYESMDD